MPLWGSLNPKCKIIGLSILVHQFPLGPRAPTRRVGITHVKLSSLHADKVKEYNREQMGIVLISMVFPLFTDALRREMRAILIVIFK